VDSPFDVLGIDPDADEAEIDRAYRRRVIETHPDQGGSASEFRLVKSAYEAIQDGYEPPEKRESDASGERNNDASDERDNDGGTSQSTTTAPGRDGRRQNSHRRQGPSDWQRRARNRHAAAETEDPDVNTRVEYLDFETITDHDWSLEDPDLFEKAAAADLDTESYGKFLAQPNETLLEAAEERGFAWPFACRGGACANCAVAVVEGELATPNDHILPEELTDEGFRLSCISTPVTETLKVVFNVKHLPKLEELRLPSTPFDRVHSDD
jgi:ferredoxin